MRALWRCRSLALGLLCLLLLVRTARAQAVGYQLNRYEPTPAGDPFALVEYPWYSSTRWFAGGLTLDYAHNLLVAQHRDAAGQLVADPAPIAHYLAGHLDLAGSLFDRVALTLSLPLLLYEAGTPFAGIGPSGTSAGDPRVGVRVRLFGQPDSLVSMSAAGYVWIPVGVEQAFTGDAGVRGMGRLTLGGLAIDHLRWAFNASFLGRQTAQLAASVSPTGNTVGHEVQLAAALGYVGLDRRLSVGPEAILSIAVAPDLPSGQERATLEVMASAHYLLLDQVQLGVGVGTALAGSPGPPDVRALFSIAYAPIRRRGSRFERVVVLPDADGHVGAVEVSEGKRKTLLDRAYSSSEVGGRSGHLRAVQSSPQAVAQQTAVLAQALPPPDRDLDGVADAVDACPDRAGSASTDPLRAGCPPAAEKVVVLPDPDGHVGGVEVNDGQHKILLDQPYASAEVGAAGAVAQLPAAPPASAIEPLAQALPPPDADEDGILDLDDACPDRPGVASSDPIRRGCPAAAEKVIVLPDPDGHVGAVAVDDGRAQALVDRAYASVEIGADGTTRQVPPASPEAIERAIAAVAGSLPMADSDGDGVRDEDDLCPERAGLASADPLRRGCPKVAEKVVLLPGADGHVGAVEIDDGVQKLVLDRAYASGELVDGRAQAVPTPPEAVLLRAVAALASRLPPPDRDDDAVLDQDDACPDRAGLPSAAPIRHGCPRTIEQVVVLADENGHVGAVEVDDGHTQTVLDQAYAAVEVGADGLSRRIAAEPTEVSARFGATLAARPPGARIILYFTARSAPVRDLTGPIDNLVAEVKSKAEYQIDVIGHTDQTGSERANQRIGLQRAQVIAARLIAAGVPAERVHASSKGSSDPAVRRKSRRVVELRNRRVEIWVR